jgi:hypothetical protein
MLDVILQQGLTLLLLMILILLSIGLGRLALYKINAPFISSGEMIFYSAGIGFGIIGYSVFFLGLLNGFYPLPITMLLILLLFLAFAGWLWIKNPTSESDLQKPKTPLDRFAFFLLLFCLSVGLILTLTPEIGKDALIYHLAVPKLFLKNQGFYFIPGNIFSNYPLHSEMLFLIGLFLQGDILSKGMHFLILLCILLGMDQFMRYRMKRHDFPALSFLIFCTIPSVFFISHMAYNDLFVTFYSMAAVFAFINWVHHLERGWLILSGVFTGLAMASKYTALILPFLGCLGILWAARRHNFHVHKALRFLFLYGLILTLWGSPFYIKNWIVTGNPFYPFIYSIFGGTGWEPEQARLYDFFVQNMGMGRAFLDYVLLPWNLSFHAKLSSPQFDGIIGPIFIATLPFAVGIRKPEAGLKIMAVYCVFMFLFWAFSAQQIRYLIPVFPFLAIAIGSILTDFRRKKMLEVILLFLITGSLIFNGYHLFRDYMNVKPLDVVVGKEDRHDFLNRMLPSFTMFDYLNRQMPHDAKIFLIYMKNWTFLCEHDCYSDSMFESYTIQKILSRASTPKEVSSALKEKGFSHILCDINYIYGSSSTFSPAEKALFDTFKNEHLELLRSDRSFFLYHIK